MLSLICISITMKGQGSIGQTEQQIRAEYGSKPDVSIFVNSIQGERNVIVVDKDGTASFAINRHSKLCNKSMFQFRNKDILQSLITKFDSTYQIITRGAAWKTVLKGHVIKIGLRYSTKLRSNMLVCYLLN
jgi:hypothetical protein